MATEVLTLEGTRFDIEGNLYDQMEADEVQREVTNAIDIFGILKTIKVTVDESRCSITIVLEDMLYGEGSGNDHDDYSASLQQGLNEDELEKTLEKVVKRLMEIRSFDGLSTFGHDAFGGVESLAKAA